MIFDFRDESPLDEKDDEVLNLVDGENDSVRDKITDFDPGPNDCVRLVVLDGEVKLLDDEKFKSSYDDAVNSVVAVWNYLKTTPMKNAARSINEVLMKYAHLFKIDSSKIKFVDLKTEDPSNVVSYTIDEPVITPGETRFMKDGEVYHPDDNPLVDQILSPSWNEDDISEDSTEG